MAKGKGRRADMFPDLSKAKFIVKLDEELREIADQEAFRLFRIQPLQADGVTAKPKKFAKEFKGVYAELTCSVCGRLDMDDRAFCVACRVGAHERCLDWDADGRYQVGRNNALCPDCVGVA